MGRNSLYQVVAPGWHLPSLLSTHKTLQSATHCILPLKKKKVARSSLQLRDSCPGRGHVTQFGPLLTENITSVGLYLATYVRTVCDKVNVTE